jgi:opacity protein-like surface antigen
MKKFAFSALCTLFIFPVFGAQYVGINGGLDHTILTSENHNPKIGYRVGASYGFKFENGFRAEVELGYQKCQFKSVQSLDDQQSKRSFHRMSYMANVLYDISQIKISEMTPYVGFGVGYCDTAENYKITKESTSTNSKLKDNRFAYQAIVGAKYNINEDYAAAMEYHYFCGQPHAKVHNVGLHLIRNF